MVTAHSKQDQEHELAASSSQYLRTRPEHFWRLNAVLGQWYRAVNLRPAITATIFFGLFSLIYVPVLAGESSLDKILNLLLILVGIFVVSLLVGGAITFHTSSPQLFAQAVIAGRPAREVFYFTAKQIKKVSGKFSRVFEHIDAGFSGHLNEIAKQDSGGWKIKIGNYKKEFDGEKAKKIADKIQQLVQRQHKRIQRIESMKRLSATELGIPARRLCDHVFQFSPALYEDRVNKFCENWQEMRRNMQDLANGPDVQRFDALVKQNDRICSDLNDRHKIQQILMDNWELHETVRQLASPHSTSDSIQAYVRGLVFVASSERQKDNPSDRRFRFLLRKQRAHPGFDLNNLLTSLIENYVPLHKDDDLPNRQLKFVTRMANKDNLWESTDDAKSYLDAIHLMAGYLTSSIMLWREMIAANFKTVFDFWCRHLQKNCFIATHSYSKTVRETLRQGLGCTNKPYVYLLVTTNIDAVDARLMEYELKSDDRASQIENIAARDQSLLVGLVQPGDRILILIGAEVFDCDGRVAHPRGLEKLDALVSRMASIDVHCLVVVVAEGYKRQDVPLVNGSFYHDHIEHVEIYRPEMTNLIIVSDDKIHPPDWESHISEQLRDSSGPK